MKKNFLFMASGFLILFSILVYNLRKPNLTLYPKFQDENVELYLLKEKFNFDIANDLLDEELPFLMITIKHGEKSVNRIISLESLDIEQKDCENKWDCPLLVLSKEKFKNIVEKKVRDPFDVDITSEISNEAP